MSWYSDADEDLINCSGCGTPECCAGCQREPGWTHFSKPRKPKARYKGGPLKPRSDASMWFCPKPKCKQLEEQVRTQVEAERKAEEKKIIHTSEPTAEPSRFAKLMLWLTRGCSTLF